MKKLLLTLSFLLVSLSSVEAICPTSGRILNAVTDVCWDCMFPIKLGSIPMQGGVASCDLPVAGGEAPICICPMAAPPFIRVGLSISYWEPARYVETVRDPFCFPSMGGLDIDPGIASMKTGTDTGLATDEGTRTFQQAHFITFPVGEILKTAMDKLCFDETGGLDIFYLSEVDPLWNSDQLSAIIEPEAVLFADKSNVAIQLACAADAATSNFGLCSNSSMFWCMGSWGSAYPLTGNVGLENPVQANAAIASRMIFKLGRQGMLCDPGVNVCKCIPTPIWVKHNYRLHAAMPLRDYTCRPIGRTDLDWGAGKSPAFMGNNFVWMIFRKRGCCLL